MESVYLKAPETPEAGHPTGAAASKGITAT